MTKKKKRKKEKKKKKKKRKKREIGLIKVSRIIKDDPKDLMNYSCINYE